MKKHFKYYISLIILVVLCTSFVGCNKIQSPQENCTFIGERINLHDEYYITVDSMSYKDTISVFKSEDDVAKSEIIGTDHHFLEIIVTIEHQNKTQPKENHELDENDFILTDHTGVQFNVKGIRIYTQFVEDGLALSKEEFPNMNAITDYEWVGTTINSGEIKTIALYYEMDKSMSAFETLVIFEVDFFVGILFNDRGVDIVLANRENDI